MHAAYYSDFRADIGIVDLPSPECPRHGVIIAVKATGVCRSDWHGWMGHDADIKPPHVPGHEFAGTIVEVGTNVKNWTLDQAVTVPFIQSCGICSDCGQGHGEVCPNQRQAGFTHWGSFAEYVAVDWADHNLVALPDSISFEVAASLGCRFATAYRAVTQLSGIQPGQWIAVFGCGGVGLAAIMVAASLGAKPIAVDVNNCTLKKAKTCGAALCINSSDNPLVSQAIADFTDGGAHASLDALGHRDTAFRSIDCLRSRGTHVQVGLMAGDHANSPIPWGKIVAKELILKGSHGMCAPNYPSMMADVKSGLLRPDLLIEQRLDLSAGIAMLMSMGERSITGTALITSFN